MATVKEMKKELDKLAKDHPDLDIKYPKKAKAAELTAILETVHAALKIQEAEKQEENDKPADDAAKEDAAPKLEVTEEMVAKYKDEYSPEYCGTFSKVNFDSPACKECAEIMAERHMICTALSVQAEREKAAIKQRAKRNGNGRKKGSQYKDYIQSLIESDEPLTRPQIIDMFVTQFPEAAKSTVTTYLSDGPNPKYCAFPFLLSIDKKTKIVRYTDVKAPGRKSAAKAAN